MYFKKSVSRAIVIVLLISIIIGLVPFNVQAHDTYFLQITINEQTRLFDASVVNDRASFTNSEWKHIEAETLSPSLTSDLKNRDKVPTNGEWSNWGNEAFYSDILNQLYEGKNTGKEGMIFSFPAIEVKDELKNNATSTDINRAIFIGSNLVTSLNEAIVFMNDGKTPSSVDETLRFARDLARVKDNGIVKNDVSGTTYTIDYGVDDIGVVNGYDPNGGDVSGSDNYLKITNQTTGAYKTLIYKLDKGYSSGLISGRFSRDDDNNGIMDDYSDDTSIIAWSHLIYQADVFYYTHGYTSEINPEKESIGELNKLVAEGFEALLTGVRNALGLYSIQELVFNNGERGTTNWYYGTMKSSWLDSIMVFYWILFAISLVVITVATVVNLLKRVYMTLTPHARVDLMEMIQDLLIAGFLLMFLFPIVSGLMRLNVKIVDVFKVYGNVEAIGAVGTTAGSGWLTVIAMFVITLIYNFTYIVRSITIALLIATSPIFVVMIAFGGKMKIAFGSWLRELIGYVFRQSIDALYLGIFLGLSAGSRGIEKFVILYTCIPLSQWLLKLITGHDGGVLGGQALGAIAGFGASVAGGVGQGARQGKKDSDREDSQNSRKGKSSEGGESGDNSNQNTNLKDSSSFEKEKDSNPIEKTGTFKTSDIERSSDDKTSSGGTALGSDGGFSPGTSNGEFKSPATGDAVKGNVNSSKSNQINSPNAKHEGGSSGQKWKTAGNIGKTLAGAGLSAGKVMLGAGILAGGGSDRNLSGIGSKMAMGGSGDLAQGSHKVAHGALSNQASGSANGESSLAHGAMEGYEFDKGTGQYQEMDDGIGTGNYYQANDYIDSDINENGSSTISRDSTMMAYNGIDNVSSNGKEGVNISYNDNLLSAEESSSLGNYQQLQSSINNMSGVEKAGAVERMQGFGVDGVMNNQYADGTSRTSINWNQAGMNNQLGVERLSKQGNTIVEKRGKDQFPQDTSKANYLPPLSSSKMKEILEGNDSKNNNDGGTRNKGRN